MAQLEAAGDVLDSESVPANLEDAFAAQLDDEDGGEPAEPDDENAAEQGEEDDQQGEEQEVKPAIPAPVSWSDADKAVFAELAPEAQEIVARRMAEMDRGFQSKTQELATVKAETERQAYEAISQVEARAAEQLEHYAALLQPRRPDPALLNVDPAAFYQMQADYEAGIAQRDQAQQQAYEARQRQAAIDAHSKAQLDAEDRALIEKEFPEYLDPSQSANLGAQLGAIGAELGYSPEMLQHARAVDILSLRKASEWKAGYDKLQTLNKEKMVNVRAARGLPPVAKPGTAAAPNAARQANFAKQREGMRAGNRDAADRAFLNFV
jgi:hypothetical protein